MIQFVDRHASAAKQSILPRKGRMDCFAALAMTARRAFTTSPRNAPGADAKSSRSDLGDVKMEIFLQR
jgi:hypothetical protein